MQNKLSVKCSNEKKIEYTFNSYIYFGKIFKTFNLAEMSSYASVDPNR